MLQITGVTGHIGFKVLATTLQAGYRVRAAVRRATQAERIKSARSIQPHLDKLEFTVVPDIIVDGAFDAALKDAIYVEHVASPLAKPASLFSRANLFV